MGSALKEDSRSVGARQSLSKHLLKALSKNQRNDLRAGGATPQLAVHAHIHAVHNR